MLSRSVRSLPASNALWTSYIRSLVSRWLASQIGALIQIFIPSSQDYFEQDDKILGEYLVAIFPLAGIVLIACSVIDRCLRVGSHLRSIVCERYWRPHCRCRHTHLS